MVDVVEIVISMSIGAIGGVIVKNMVIAGNYTGTDASISDLFVFTLLAVVLLGALILLRRTTKK